MIHQVRRHVDVERDILDLAAWIARDSRPAAVRFFDSVESSITSLRTLPARGSIKVLRHPDWRASGASRLAASRST